MKKPYNSDFYEYFIIVVTLLLIVIGYIKNK
jgi:hypothetical protein